MYLNELSGCELVLLANVISVAISEDMSAEEIDVLGNFFSAIGQNLCTIATVK